MKQQPINIVGKIFGELTVLQRTKMPNKKSNGWLCICSCGATTKVLAGDLNRGSVYSCGHILREKAKILCIKRNTIHGLANHPLYDTWYQMLRRCECENDISYKNYGGRGIKVSEDWHDLRNFIRDMSPKPDPSLTLERINNNGNYEKDNCKWATWEEQVSNRRIAVI